MDYTTTVLVTLIAYKVILIGIGFYANQKTKSTEDYFIGGRGLGPWVAAISSAASASSAWTLLGMSGAAYAMGLPAIWLVPAVVSGYVFNWLWLAPRLQKKAEQEQSVTLSELLAHGSGQFKKPILWLCSLCIVFAFTFYVAAQFQAAGNTFASTFNVSMESSIALGTLIILIYTLLGGFWAVSITDTLQGILMAVAGLILPIAGLIAVGGFAELWLQMQSVYTGSQLQLSGEYNGLMALAFIVGLFGIGLGQPGQPHVVNRMMALRDQKAVQQAKIIAIGWAAIVVGGMLIVGWCAKVLIEPVANNEQALLEVTNVLFPPVVAGVMIAAILSAIMSTADSQLLVSASAMSYDISEDKNHKNSLLYSRLTVVLMCIISMLIAIYIPKDIFTRVLFAWNALGAAFGPLLIVKVISKSVDGKYAFAAIATGFSLSVILSLFPSTPGDYIERLIPFSLAFVIAWLGRR
ncbi:sodium/proline symporter [Thalassotalea sp. ND16A]|uniref:sodium/proline symporter n=1 Tax=Thalassotalea sp. ND16A TaxID=1535422 RepID=UPI00051A5542|nr:sodium/proline symporter [Thalassotalea sp. ND16A]KGJ98070.1 hypothetical protein ND16A_0875 [Thalassotalea sp. ND16A]